jgi:hypothetical protein
MDRDGWAVMPLPRPEMGTRLPTRKEQANDAGRN